VYSTLTKAFYCHVKHGVDQPVSLCNSFLSKTVKQWKY
jgi:hypothetical protein